MWVSTLCFVSWVGPYPASLCKEVRLPFIHSWHMFNFKCLSLFLTYAMHFKHLHLFIVSADFVLCSRACLWVNTWPLKSIGVEIAILLPLTCWISSGSFFLTPAVNSKHSSLFWVQVFLFVPECKSTKFCIGDYHLFVLWQALAVEILFIWYGILAVFCGGLGREEIWQFFSCSGEIMW